MKNAVMAGIWRMMIQVPPALWKPLLKKAVKEIIAEQDFMTFEHRRVHHYAVRALPGLKSPLRPKKIADGLDMPLERVESLLDDLEKHMTFVYRTNTRDVSWAYPVTVEKTPHMLVFDTGETVYAA